MTAAVRQKVTIKDVARAAGMSVGAASGVLNGATGFSDEARKKIWDSAAALNYQPNAQARGLRSGNGVGKRPNSGIIIHISHMGDENKTVSDFHAMHSAMLSMEAERLGLYTITYRYHGAKGFQCPPVLNGHVDGAIVGTPHIEVVKALKNRIPMVLMDVPFSLDLADVTMVNVDTRHGFMRLFEFLRENGHRKIGTISALNICDGLMNETNFHNEILAAAKDFGVEIPDGCDLPITTTPETHEREMRVAAAHFAKHIKSKCITAIVTPTVSYTTSFYTIFKEMGVDVPGELSLAGVHHEIKEPDFGVTSVTYDWPAIFKTGLETLRDIVSGKIAPGKKILVAPGFYTGRTTKKISGGAL